MATQKEIADHLDLSDRRVRDLIKSGILPSSKGSGGLDCDECRKAYIVYLRGLSSGQVRPEAGDLQEGIDPQAEQKLTQERWRLTKAQAEAQELKNEVSKRLLIPADFAVFALSQLAPEIAALMDTLPMTMRRKHPELEARHVNTLEREATKIRNACAGFAEKLTELADEYFESAE